MFKRSNAPERSSMCRNVIVSGRRTSIRMESVFWTCLEAVCKERGLSLFQILSEIDEVRGNMNLTAATRLHLIMTFRQKAKYASGPRQGLGASAAPPPLTAGVDAVARQQGRGHLRRAAIEK